MIAQDGSDAYYRESDREGEGSDSKQVHELLIVEGVSAANAVEKVFDPRQQRVFAVQGKPMNVLRASDRKVRANKVADDLWTIIGRGHVDDTRPYLVPFDRVILLTDGDVDGVHAKALLLLMIARVRPEIIEEGRLFTVRAPMFSIRCAEMDQPVFAYSLDGRQLVFDRLRERQASQVQIKHFKGLASMDDEDLWAACVNPETRQLSPLTASQVSAARAALSSA